MIALVSFEKKSGPGDFVQGDEIEWSRRPGSDSFTVEGPEAWVRYMLAMADDKVLGYQVL